MNNKPLTNYVIKSVIRGLQKNVNELNVKKILKRLKKIFKDIKSNTFNLLLTIYV